MTASIVEAHLGIDQFQSRLHKFALDEIRPVAAEWDRLGETPWPVIERAAEAGIYDLDLTMKMALEDPTGMMLPTAMEELYWGDGGIAMSIMATTLAVGAILASGTPEQVAEWLPRCYRGPGDRLALAAFASSEYESGYDVAGYRTYATHEPLRDTWTINGTKAWITNGGIADVNVVIATVDPTLGTRGQAAFIVPKETPGLTMGRKYNKLGLRASHTAEVVLADVEVPSSHLLGGKAALDDRLDRVRAQGSEWEQPPMQIMEITRPAVGAQALGIGRAAMEYALEHATQRRIFDSKLVEKQGISFLFADLATEYEATKALIQKAISPKNQWHDRPSIGAMAKLKGGRFATWASERAMQVLGAQGYATSDHPIERWYRDAKVYDIFEGSEQIMQVMIARDLTGLRIR